MDKETITLFARYNQAVNKSMNEIIKTLSPAEWDKNMGGFYKSVHGLCSHLYIADFNWLKRYSKFRIFTVFKDAFFNREPYSYREVIFNDMNEYLSGRPELDEYIIRFASELNNDDLEGILQYTDSKGANCEWVLGIPVVQCFNHETFHRGMISLYLEMLGRENDFSTMMKVLKH
jgi:uncharacterized damage-inducible protein DinB